MFALFILYIEGLEKVTYDQPLISKKKLPRIAEVVSFLLIKLL